MKNKSYKKGFTLVEAIIAAAVLGIAVVVLMQVFPSGIRTSSLSRQTTIATNLAQSVIEQNTSKAYLNIVSQPKSRVNSDPNSSFYSYFQQVDVSYVDSNLNDSAEDTGLKKIIVTISWTEQGSEKQVQIPTLVSNK